LSLLEKVAGIFVVEDQDGLKKMVADVIRVLVIDHGVCWKTELLPDLIKLYRFCGRPVQVDFQLIDQAINSLNTLDIIEIEDRTRAEWLSQETYEDQFIKLKDVSTVKSALADDQTLVRYMLNRAQRIREAIRTSFSDGSAEKGTDLNRDCCVD